MKNLSENLLKYLRNKSEQITVDILEKAKDCFYDYMAVTEAGALQNKERWSEFCEHAPVGSTALIGLERTTDSKTACLVNGYNAHSLELDDGQRFAMIHLGASVITAIYAAASENKISERRLLLGIIMGYETACRIAVSMQPSHKKRGFHTAGTCGTIGAAVGTAYALGMNDTQLMTVLCCAVASAAGILEIQEQSSELKAYNLGRAAMDGLSAAYMGFTDFSGPDDILDGERGFLKLFSDGGNPEKAIEEKSYFEIERIYVKPYAACRHCHSAIEAMLALRDQCYGEVSKIVVKTYKLAVKGHDHTVISGISSAKLSIPYSVAAAFVLGKVDMTAFTAEMIVRKEIIDLASKVQVIEDEDFSEENPQKRIAEVQVLMKNGQNFISRVDYAKGEPENPMRREEILKKAISLIGKERAAELFEVVYQKNNSHIKK